MIVTLLATLGVLLIGTGLLLRHLDVAEQKLRKEFGSASSGDEED